MSTDTKEQSRILASFDRGPNEQLRVSYSQYNGKPFLDVRIWTKDTKGYWSFTTRGCSIRMNEARAVAAALHQSSPRKPRKRRQRTPADNAHIPTGIDPQEITAPDATPPWEDDGWAWSPSKIPPELA